MAIGDALVAPTGVQNQMYGQPSRVPGYSQGLGQAPGQMALPPEPMPIGRPTAVVGGPAYFTPEGYNAPPQPTEAFMPTDVRPDPIGQQFMRQMQSPMGQQFQAQYEATQAPMREAEMARRAEEQAAQDARFQEMMDRIAELEGQLAQPSPMPEPEPYVPGQTPFPGIPDYLRDLDFSNMDFRDILNIDYDDIMRQYNDRETDTRNDAQRRIDAIRQNRGELPNPRNIKIRTAQELADIGYDEADVEEILERQQRKLNIPITRAEEPVYTTMPVGEPVRLKMPELPDFSNIPAPESFSESPDFMPGSGMGRIGQGVATDRESLIGKKIFGQTITPESFAGRETARSPFLRATPRPDLPTPNISGPFGFMNKSAPAPVMPDFSNMDFSSLRNFNLR